MRQLLKRVIKDTPVEPYVRWSAKPSRRLSMLLDLVRNEVYDRQAAELLARVLEPASFAIDVGAHKGQFLKLFMQHVPDGKHYAFEPILTMAQSLRAQLPAVHIHECALSERQGEATFYVTPDTPGSSGLDTRKFTARGKERLPIVVQTRDLRARAGVVEGLRDFVRGHS